MILAARVVPALRAPDAAVDGGGGTTSCVPKSFPMTLLTNDVLPAVDGGGGTTAGLLAPTLPLSRRRRSREESADGGGAITEGADRFSFAVRAASRAGAETGGGTTAAFIRTREGATSRPAAVGAGGITLPLSAGTERGRSREMRVDAGATICASSAGAVMVRSRETLGAGATMLVVRVGAISV